MALALRSFAMDDKWKVRMIVETQCNGREFTGVAVGTADVQRYFPRENRVIQIELDHLQIQCGLRPGFWNGHPQISDPRLGAWLESKNFHGKPGAGPIPLAMIPSGKNCFRLQPVDLAGRGPVRATPVAVDPT